MDENTIEINWEEAPEGTTHYDTADKDTPWMKHCNRRWYFFDSWGDWTEYHLIQGEDTSNFVPKPETTPTVDSYTNPKADPFAVSLKRCLTSQTNLEEYLESIYDKVDQEDEDFDVFVIDMTASLEKQGEDMLNFLTSKKEAEKKSLNVSWYDYDKEELIGLPEKGEIVYDKLNSIEVEYLGTMGCTGYLIVESYTGDCHEVESINIKPLNYKDSPTRQVRKEQHKLLEDLVGDVDYNLQGHTHKAGAIDLYNKGWRVSKEGV